MHKPDAELMRGMLFLAVIDTISVWNISRVNFVIIFNSANHEF